MKAYKCLVHQRINFGSYSIEPVQPKHIELIRQWRNAQMDILRQRVPITKEGQEKYYAEHVWPAMDMERPENILVSFLLNHHLIGYGGLVHISWEHRRAEVSFLVNPQRLNDNSTYETYMGNFLILIKKIAFNDLNFNRLYTETYDVRPVHISILERSGFVLEGRMKEHVNIDNIYIDSLIHGCLKSNYKN